MKITWLLFFIIIAAIDLKYRKVKNSILIVYAIILSIYLYFYPVNLLSFFLAALFCFVFFLIFYMLGVLGAGDVKFSIFIGLFLGLSSGLISVLFFSFCFCAAHSLILIAINYFRQGFFGVNFDFSVRDRVRKIPYAGYLAISAITWMMSGMDNVQLISV